MVVHHDAEFDVTYLHGAALHLQPNLGRVGHPETYADHPRALYAREGARLECGQAFFADRVFGPNRATHLDIQLANTSPHAHDCRRAGSQRSRRRSATQPAAKATG